MVASRQVEIPHKRGTGQHRGLQCTCTNKRENNSCFLRQYVVRAAKIVEANLLELNKPGIAELVSGKKIFSAASYTVGKLILRKQLGISSQQRRIIPANSSKQSDESKQGTFHKHFSLIKPSQNKFRYQSFEAVYEI